MDPDCFAECGPTWCGLELHYFQFSFRNDWRLLCWYLWDMGIQSYHLEFERLAHGVSKFSYNRLGNPPFSLKSHYYSVYPLSLFWLLGSLACMPAVANLQVFSHDFLSDMAASYDGMVPMVNQIYHLEFERAPSHVRLSLGSSGGKVYYWYVTKWMCYTLHPCNPLTYDHETLHALSTLHV